MRSLIAVLCLSLLVGCAAPGAGDVRGDAPSAGCPRHGDGPCGIGPQGKQNKR